MLALRLLCDQVPTTPYFNPDHGNRDTAYRVAIQESNDYLHTTHAMVLGWFDRAITAARTIRSRGRGMVATDELLAALQANLAHVARGWSALQHAVGGNTTAVTPGHDGQPGGRQRALNVDMQELVQEQLRVILLRTKQTVIDVVTVYQGTVNAASTRIAEILRPAILANAPGIIVVHNHPSGDTDPSGSDMAVTRKLLHAAALMDIQVFDHVIVARGAAPMSMARRGQAGFDDPMRLQ